MSSEAQGLKDYLARERTRVEAALERALNTADEALRPEIARAVRQGVLTGGKRLRPILCVAAWRACGGDDTDAAYDLGVSVELIHAYSLMHDDLPCMDDAELRRGQPTAHRVFGEAVTMEAGAALIPLAGLQAWSAAGELGCPDPERRSILQLLMDAAGGRGMVGGQFLDLMGEGRSLGEEELTTLHGKKTGALLTAPLVMGGMAAGASPPALAALEEYGKAIGLAFQVADDILDATSTAEELGKNPSDQELDKSTYVALFGLEEAGRKARGLVQDAVRALEEGGIESPPLEALARYIVQREN